MRGRHVLQGEVVLLHPVQGRQGQREELADVLQVLARLPLVCGPHDVRVMPGGHVLRCRGGILRVVLQSEGVVRQCGQLHEVLVGLCAQ